jgi:hypothetical protein
MRAVEVLRIFGLDWHIEQRISGMVGGNIGFSISDMCAPDDPVFGIIFPRAVHDLRPICFAVTGIYTGLRTASIRAYFPLGQHPQLMHLGFGPFLRPWNRHFPFAFRPKFDTSSKDSGSRPMRSLPLSKRIVIRPSSRRSIISPI